MVQFARPDNDDTRVAWLTDADGTTNLYQRIDEVSASDTDYVKGSDPPPTSYGSEYLDAGLSTVTDPAVATGHILRWRYRKEDAGGRQVDVRITLRQGTTTIATRTFTNVSGTVSQDNYTLSAGEANSITDYSNLNVRIDGISVGGGQPKYPVVTWVEFEVPDLAVRVEHWQGTQPFPGGII